jgi:hypothetical protein
MATRPENKQSDDLVRANAELRAALEECQALLERTRKMLESEQDNSPWPRGTKLI